MKDVGNKLINITPFKGPFKGKGANRKVVQILEDDLKDILDEMEQLRIEYVKAVPRPKMKQKNQPPYLNIFKPRGIPALMWRIADTRSERFKLFEDDIGKEILSRYMDAAFNVFVEVEKQRLHLNFKSTLLAHTIMKYKVFMSGHEHLENIER